MNSNARYVMGTARCHARDHRVSVPSARSTLMRSGSGILLVIDNDVVHSQINRQPSQFGGGMSSLFSHNLAKTGLRSANMRC